MTGAILDDEYRAEWATAEDDPGSLVFLLGCQRSGTTFLHLRLAESGAFRFVTAYDVYASDRLVHNARHGCRDAACAAFREALKDAGGDRGIDTIPAGPETPEEYGLVLVPSGQDTLRYGRPDTTPETLPRLREFCAKKALLEGRGRPLLLKSPPDYPDAIPCLSAAWRRARFVAIQRHPLHTLESQVRAWRELVRRKNLYLTLIDRSYRELFEDTGRRLRTGMFLHSPAAVGWLADCLARAHNGFLSTLDTWSSADLLTVRYEDLCADQTAVVRRLAEFLELDIPVPIVPPAPRAARISSEVQAAFDARRESFAPYLERFGYAEAAV